MYQYLIFTMNISLCGYITVCYPFTCSWTLGLVLVWVYYPQSCYENARTSLCLVKICFYFFCLLRNRMAGPYGRCIFNCFRNCQAVFQSGCTILHDRQQRRRLPLVRHPHLHLVCIQKLFFKNSQNLMLRRLMTPFLKMGKRFQQIICQKRYSH